MQKRNDSIKNITPDEFSKMNSEEKILKMAEGFETPTGKPKDQVLDSLLTKIENSNQAKPIHFINRFQAVAAIFIAILGVYAVSVVFSKERMTTKYAQQSELTLPDGSAVTLNSGSNITWSKKHFTEKRYLTLKGEAFFDVEKGNEFIIKTNNGTVEILGTQLNVFSRDDEFWVSCIAGKVRVNSNNQQQTILPGEIAQLSSSGLVKRKNENINKTTSWKQGLFYFEDKPLVSIFDELERQFDVSIKYKEENNRSITVSFSNNNLKEVLDIVCIPMELDYEIHKNQKIRIYKRQK